MKANDLLSGHILSITTKASGKRSGVSDCLHYAERVENVECIGRKAGADLFELGGLVEHLRAPSYLG